MATYGKKAVLCMIVAVAMLAMSGIALAGCPGPDEGMPKPDPQEIERHIGEKLAKLVDAGTITKDQSDRVLKFWREKDRERQADFAAMKNMSPDERKAYMDKKRQEKSDMVGDLAKAAGLSEEQAKAVADAVRPPRPPHGAR